MYVALPESGKTIVSPVLSIESRWSVQNTLSEQTNREYVSICLAFIRLRILTCMLPRRCRAKSHRIMLPTSAPHRELRIQLLRFARSSYSDPRSTRERLCCLLDESELCRIADTRMRNRPKHRRSRCKSRGRDWQNQNHAQDCIQVRCCCCSRSCRQSKMPRRGTTTTQSSAPCCHLE